jgi:hypothetical protein
VCSSLTDDEIFKYLQDANGCDSNNSQNQSQACKEALACGDQNAQNLNCSCVAQFFGCGGVGSASPSDGCPTIISPPGSPGTPPGGDGQGIPDRAGACICLPGPGSTEECRCSFGVFPGLCDDGACYSVRNDCKVAECQRLGISPCPGMYSWAGSGKCSGGAPDNCPDPTGGAFEGCPGSGTMMPSPLTGNGENPSPPSEKNMFVYVSTNIRAVKIKINNLTTCIPVLCGPDCSGYELCE